MALSLYVEKQPPYDTAAQALLAEARDFLGVPELEGVRVIDRYDIEGCSPACSTWAEGNLFGTNRTETLTTEPPACGDCAALFAVAPLPGQFDQAADSAAHALRLHSPDESPSVGTARVFILQGDLSADDVERIKTYLINPVESKEVSPEPPAQNSKLVGQQEQEHSSSPEDADPVSLLLAPLFVDSPGEGELVEGVYSQLDLAMDLPDFQFTVDHFQQLGRAPSPAELTVIDTYWSDHCRHTTFFTELENIDFQDARAEDTFTEYLRVREELGRTKPVSLMDLGTIAAKYLRSKGKLDGLDISEEVNAATVHIEVDVDGKKEPWLLLFKNETHNHPTEIEPFGGAGTCIGGAIRDPLSGRAYVYQAMRITGAADPTAGWEDTLEGKLPQRQISQQAAAGYSSYGNQIGVPAGLVEEVYHPGYLAKRMELGAVVGAAPTGNVVRAEPIAGDVVVLLGGRTGRDGVGGATGSSKEHSTDSAEISSSEVQKGNAPEERKIQRLFKDPQVAALIKRSNDFGAGGVAVAVGELAAGVTIDLDKIPTKYAGLTGLELAVSESQERMAVVLDAGDVDQFLAAADLENLEATVIAQVTEEPALVMTYRGERIVDISREFLDSNGTPKRTVAVTPAVTREEQETAETASLKERLGDLVTDLNVASQKGLVELFDSSAGAATVLAPLGGRRQLTPPQAMAATIPVPHGTTTTSSVMSSGFNPLILEADPYAGSYLAVVESLAKLVATGAPLDDAYLTFQEYFPRLGQDPARWGLPVAALLGALRAQLELGFAAIGGKDSMSGSFEDLDVPPTLVSFAVTVADAEDLISPEFKQAGSRLALLEPTLGEDGLPTADSLLEIWQKAKQAMRSGAVLSAWTPVGGGIAEGLVKMALGNRIGVRLEGSWDLFAQNYGALLLETTPDCELGETIGVTTEEFSFTAGGETVSLAETEELWNAPLQAVFPTPTSESSEQVRTLSFPGSRSAGRKPRSVLAAATQKLGSPTFAIPVFPGSSGEYETAKAVEAVGGRAEIFVIRDRTADQVAQSYADFSELIARSQGMILPGGLTGGDHPGGPAKLVTAFFQNPQVRDAVNRLLADRDGLVAGFGSGFSALLNLGLLTTGQVQETLTASPSFAANPLGAHHARLVETRVSSTISPWFANTKVGEVYLQALSTGYGRLSATAEQLEELAGRGQIAAQYVDAEGQASMAPSANPVGSAWAVEALSSPTGRVLGKMGHPERVGPNLYRNVPGEADMGIFAAGVAYFAAGF